MIQFMFSTNTLRFSQSAFRLLVLFICVALVGCSQLPDQRAGNTKERAGKERLSGAHSEKQQALLARGFTQTGLGNINYASTRQCSGFELQSHRGSIRFPENSIYAVYDAIDNNFDVIEIDVRITGDDVWVLHHDARTGRESGTIDNKRRKIESMNYAREWGYLRHRDLDTGTLTNEVPPSFRELADMFGKVRKPHQKLNIEIKSLASVHDLKLLDYLAHKYIGNNAYFFSSLEMRNLSRLRNINPDLYLAFIQSPAKQSLNRLASDLKRGAASDPVYQQKKERIESLQAKASRRHREKRYDDGRGLAELSRQLQRNFGLVLDIRHYLQSAKHLKSGARARGVKLATYSINGHDYHERSLLAQPKALRPDSAIIDDTVYGFCSVFELPQVKPFISSNKQAQLIASMPRDLDLERLNELQVYYPNNLYPAVGGVIKSLMAENARVPDQSLNKRVDLTIGDRQKEESFRFNLPKTIEIDLRGKH